MSASEAVPGSRSRIVVEVWADLGCPWCYIGKHRLTAAIDRRDDRDHFALRIRSFELNPGASRIPETIEEAFVRSHGGSARTVVEAERRMQALAEHEGLPFSLDRTNANTFDFHRVVHHAEQSALGVEFFSHVQDRFFAGELDPFAPGALVAAARSVGLEEEPVREVLASDDFSGAVRSDAEEGAALGATGVPFVVVGRRVALAGAQPVEEYSRLLDAAIESGAGA